MNSKGGMGTLLIFFMGVVVVLALMPQIADNMWPISNKYPITAESHDIGPARINDTGGINESYEFYATNAPVGSDPAKDWRVNKNCPLTNFVLKNSSTTFANGTDYIVDLNTGNVTLLITTFDYQLADNVTTYDYDYCPLTYSNDAGGRALADLVILMATIALLVGAVWFYMKQYNEAF